MTRLLIDYHHSDLFESYQLTFGDRFGWEVVAPFGMEWFDEGIWQFERKWHFDAVARQYLVGIWGDAQPDANGIVEVPDKTHPGRTLRGITLAAAQDARWDYVISSLPDNDVGLHGLARLTGANFGIQLGNVGQQSAWNLADFALCSTTLPFTPIVPHVIYRQEFSLSDFRFTLPPRGEGPNAISRDFTVASFVQCLPENPLAYRQFLDYARTDESFGWGVFGAYGSHPEDELARGNLDSTPRVAMAMRGTDVIWHTKEWSDGYGHVIHNAFAVGRPVFGIEPYYADKLAGPLWVDGETSIDISRRDKAEVLGILRRLRDDEDEHVRMCEAAARRFREVVDFDEDARNVRALMERVREAVAA